MQFNRIELHVKEAEFSYQLRHVFEVHTLTHASIQAANKSVSVRERGSYEVATVPLPDYRTRKSKTSRRLSLC
jgi:hypothetical protein